jgi:hypothetical protein
MTDARSTDTPATAPDAPAGIAALVARIAASPILSAQGAASGAASGAAWAPPGYDEADIRILEWIASHQRGRHARARLADLAA